VLHTGARRHNINNDRVYLREDNQIPEKATGETEGRRTFPVDPSTLNSSRSSSPSRVRSTIKNLGTFFCISSSLGDEKRAHLCDITRSTLSKMFFGQDFLNLAQRVSSVRVDVASTSSLASLFFRLFLREVGVWISRGGKSWDEPGTAKLSSLFRFIQYREYRLFPRSKLMLDKISSVAEQVILKVLASGPIPKHVAFVMDGNRRYARKEHKQTLQGHTAGFVALRRVRVTPCTRQVLMLILFFS
jgi:Putative undecaprenyl diphosphate synthase